MSVTIQLRRDTAANWTSVNPVLNQGELGEETDTSKAKMGDGATAWNSLPYWSPGGGGSGAVSSVFTRTGAVTAQTGDYTVSQVTGAAPLASPALTGTPTAPTASALTDDTQIATTAYTDAAVGVEASRAETAEGLLAPKASPALTGTPTAPTASALTDSTQVATTAYADSAVSVETGRAETAEALKAPLASPALTGNPTAPTQSGSDNSTKLATTAYVTTAVATETTRAEAAEAAKLPLAGGTMSGPIAMGSSKVTGLANGSAAQDAAAFGQLPSSLSPLPLTQGGTGLSEASNAALLSGLGAAALAGAAFTGEVTVQTPVNAGDAVTKAYADGIAVGLSIKQSAQEGTAAALPSNTYSNGSSGAGATLTATANGALTVDGIAVTANDRVLVQNEATASHNGIYSVTATGSGGAPYVLTRTTDMDVASQFPGAFVFVEQGTVNAGCGFVIASEGPFTVGTTAVNWTKFSSLPVPVPIADGGTSASTATGALSALGAAPLASPGLTGTPTAPTASALTSNTQLATTAYADSAVGVETSRAETAEALKAPLASPALTGTPTAPTPSGGDNSTKIATTAFVTGAVPSLPLSIANGGSGTATGAPQNDVFAGPSSGGTGTPLFRALVAADLPTGTTSAKGALQLDGTAGDIQPVGTTAAAGSVGKPPDAGHVHVGPLVGGTNFGPTGFGIFNSTRGATANLLYLMVVQIPVAVTLTGLMIQNGGTAAGNVLVGIYNSAGSSLLASSSSTAQGSPNTVQQIPFTGTYAAPAGTYIFAVMYSSSSATGGAGFVALASSAAQGGFTLPSSVTPPTAPAAVVYPAISY